MQTYKEYYEALETYLYLMKPFEEINLFYPDKTRGSYSKKQTKEFENKRTKSRAKNKTARKSRRKNR